MREVFCIKKMVPKGENSDGLVENEAMQSASETRNTHKNRVFSFVNYETLYQIRIIIILKLILTKSEKEKKELLHLLYQLHRDSKKTNVSSA